MAQEVRIPAQVLVQKGIELYMFSMNSERLRKIAWVAPKSRDDPMQIQRILDPSRLESIGRYVKQEHALLPNNIVLNLSGDVVFQRGATDREGLLVFPSEEGKFGYILDGQHRLYGFERSGGIEFDLPVVALLNADRSLAYKIFADINSKQQKATADLLQLLYLEIGELAEEEELAVQVIHSLNHDQDSPLRGKIKIYAEDKRTWITSPNLTPLIRAIVGIGGPLQGMTRARQATILKNYFRAFSELYPDAWNDRKDHIITKYMGFYLMCGLFERIFRRCQLYEGSTMEVGAIKRQLKKIRAVRIRVLPGQEIELPQFTWHKDPLTGFAGRKGMELIRKSLLLALPERDEEAAPA